MTLRSWITLTEGLSTPLYHGSVTEFSEGFVLLPQSDGYIDAERDNPAHEMLESIIEKYRPANCIPRREAVFMVADPDEIDYAGGYDDHIYVVEPQGEVTRCNLTWYSELYSLCEHETLSAAEARAEGREWYPDWEEPECREYALNYWNANPKDGSDLYEYLARSAVIRQKI